MAVDINPSSGSVVSGAGTVHIPLDNVDTGMVGGDPNFIDDNHFVFAGTEDGKAFHIYIYDVRTRRSEIAKVNGVDVVGGGNHVFGGGGRWARWLGGVAGPGLTDSTGFESKKAGILGVGPDGVLYYFRDYQSGKGIIARNSKGEETQVLKDDQVTALSLRGINGGCVWAGYDLRCYGWNLPVAPLTVPGEPVYEPCVVFVGGKPYLVYHTQDRLLCHPLNDPSRGWVLATGPTYNAFAIEWRGRIRIAWTLTSGGGVGSQRIYHDANGDADLDITSPMRPLYETVVAVGRRAWFGFFTFNDPNHPTLPGNCDLFIDRKDNLVKTLDGKLIAAYASGADEGNLTSLEVAIEGQKKWGVPVLAYWTRKLWPGPLPRGADWLHVEAYQGVSESDRNFDNAVRAQLKRHPATVILGQCYTSNGIQTKELTHLPAIYSRMMRDLPQVLGCISFSGWGRPTGLQDHPEAQPAWAEFAAGITGPLPVPDPKPPKPPDPPEPPKMTTTGFLAWVNKYVTAENGGDDVGLLNAVDRPGDKPQRVGPWETFNIIPLSGDWVNIQSNSGRYWSAENGGGSTVVANRKVAGPWERFRLVKSANGKVSFGTFDMNHYVTCEDTGLLNATRKVLGPWEQFALAAPGSTLVTTPPVPIDPTPGEGRKGQTVADGKKHFRDDLGRYWPLGATLFWAMSGWRDDRDRYKQNAAWLKAKGVDYLRILGQVGWTGHEISEDWPNYVDILGELVDYHTSIGLKTQVTCIGGGHFNADKVVDKIIQALKPRPTMIHSVEVANEWWQNFNDEAKMKGLGDRLKANLPCLVALSNPNTDLVAKANEKWVPAHGSLGMGHFDRDDTKADWKWRHVRKPWEAGDPSIQSSHNEPGGPRSSVAEFPEAIHCTMMRAVAIMCGWEDFILHNGAGVMGVVDPSHNRPANVWEVPGIDVVMAAVRNLDKILPAWLSDGRLTRGGSPVVGPHPLAADEFWPDGNDDHGVVRDYARVNGNEFVQTLIGVKKKVNLKCTSVPSGKTGWKVDFYDPMTQQVTKTTTVKKGETIDIGVLSADSRGYGAWIVRGVGI